jgi:hypothetical protein
MAKFKDPSIGAIFGIGLIGWAIVILAGLGLIGAILYGLLG